MFGFTKPEDGSRVRFYDRRGQWSWEKLSVTKYYFWWVIHNCVAHPLIGIIPVKKMFKFHDWTSHRMFPPKKVVPEKPFTYISEKKYKTDPYQHHPGTKG